MTASDVAVTFYLARNSPFPHHSRDLLSINCVNKFNFDSPEPVVIEPHQKSSSSNFFLFLISYAIIIMYFTRKIKRFLKNFLKIFWKFLTEHKKRRDRSPS